MLATEVDGSSVDLFRDEGNAGLNLSVQHTGMMLVVVDEGGQ
jgi:hypothetical protein